jgi:DNA-binding LacI/PurR family transcriptional regulator
MQAAAQAMGQQILVLSAATENEINEAFATVREGKADAIVYSANPFVQVERDRLVALAAQYSIPAIYASGYPAEPLVSFQINRQLSGWNLPPLIVRAFRAHGQEQT